MSFISKFIKKTKEKVFPTETTTIKHYTLFFTTFDGIVHKYSHFKYINENILLCSGPEYIMIDIKNDGYVKDDEGNMYFFDSISKIEWKMDDVIHNVIKPRGMTGDLLVYYSKNSPILNIADD